MIAYGITASISFETSMKIEGSMVEHAKETIRELVQTQGIDALLDSLNFSDEYEYELSPEEMEELVENETLQISADSLKEYLVGLSLGLVEKSAISPEKAQEILEQWEGLEQRLKEYKELMSELEEEDEDDR